MKTIVLAYHNIGCIGIKALLANGYEIQAVFTHEDDPHEAVWFESVAELAAANGFVQVEHRLEFFGLCPACAAEAAS